MTYMSSETNPSVKVPCVNVCVDLPNSEFPDGRFKFNRTPVPLSMQKAVNEITSQHKKPVMLRSMSYLVRDLFFAYVCFVAFEIMKGVVPECIRYPAYSFCMGMVIFPLWVLGHECGHGAFGTTKFQNDAVGFILHSALLFPYYSFQYSHGKHHKYGNHLIHGETHVPSLKGDFKAAVFLSLKRAMHKIFGSDHAFALVYIVFHMSVGIPLYLLINLSGGRIAADMKTKLDLNRPWNTSHFNPFSQVMPGRLAAKVALSTAGCLAMCMFLVYNGKVYDYVGPFMVFNGWLSIITWLQHTHPAIPHYGAGASEYGHIDRALCSVDRSFPWVLSALHHHTGPTHVCHHLNSGIPHYEAVECTRKLKALLGDRYFHDSTPFWKAVMIAAQDCIYVDSLDGLQFYRK